MLACSAVLVVLYPAAFASVFAHLFSQHPLRNGARPTPAAMTDYTPPELFYHLGGNGPWIPKINGTIDEGIEPPAGCRVTQVHMVWHCGGTSSL